MLKDSKIWLIDGEERVTCESYQDKGKDCMDK